MTTPIRCNRIAGEHWLLPPYWKTRADFCFLLCLQVKMSAGGGNFKSMQKNKARAKEASPNKAARSICFSGLSVGQD